MRIIVAIIPTELVTNSLLYFFCPFLKTKNKNPVFSKLVVWQREIFLFSVYNESFSNLIGFYKRIFLHVIPVRIIVPCLETITMNKYQRWITEASESFQDALVLKLVF